jgi:hypothetical protein
VSDADRCRRIYQPWLSSPFAHYGLGVQFYTHFTSPIRRYADVLVHRLLKQAVGGTAPEAALGETRMLDQARKARQEALARPVTGVVKDPSMPVRGVLSAQSSEASSLAGGGDDDGDDGMLDSLFGTASAAVATAPAPPPAPPARSAASSSDEEESEEESDNHLDSLFLAAQPPASKGVDWSSQQHVPASGEQPNGDAVGVQPDGDAIGVQPDGDAIGVRPGAKQLPASISGVVDIAARANLQTRAAKLASRACAEIFLSLWLRARCVVVEAVITRIRCSTLAALTAESASAPPEGIPLDLMAPGLTVELGLWCPRFDLRDRVELARQSNSGTELLVPACLTASAAYGASAAGAAAAVPRAPWEMCNPASYQVPVRAGPAETEAAAVANARLGLLQDCGSLRVPVAARSCDDVRMHLQTRAADHIADAAPQRTEIDGVTITGKHGKWQLERSQRVLCLAWCDMTLVQARPPSIQLSPLYGPVSSFLARLSDTQDYRTATLPDAVVRSMTHGSIIPSGEAARDERPAPTKPCGEAARDERPAPTKPVGGDAVRPATATLAAAETSAGWAIGGMSLGVSHDSSDRLSAAAGSAADGSGLSSLADTADCKAVARGRWRMGGFQGRVHNRATRAWAAAVAPEAQAARAATRRVDADADFESAHGTTSSQLLGDAHALREAKARAEARMHRQQAQKRNARIKEKRKQK